jgi:L-iditol 2-dehydrogenase
MTEGSHMRAAVYYANDDVRIEDRPVPEIGADEFLFRVEACGVCGSDVMEWYRVKKGPRVLGHEAAGVVEQVGEQLTRFKPGDRVFVNHHVPCGTCVYCRRDQETVCRTLRSTNFDPGGFAEKVRVPAINAEKGAFRLPDSMSFDQATFIEPVACALRGQRVAGFKPGMSVAVLGSGLAGLLHVALARARGAGKIFATDISDWRLDRAREFGADEVFDGREDVPELIRAANGDRGADLVIVCTAAIPVLKQALRVADAGGTVLLYGVAEPGKLMQLDVGTFWASSVKLVSTYANSPADAEEAIGAISDGQVPIGKMITHKLPLAETGEAFRLTASAAESLKVIVEPNK